MSNESSINSTILTLGIIAVIAFFGYAIYTGMKVESVKVGTDGFEIKASPGATVPSEPPPQPTVSDGDSRPVKPIEATEPVVKPTSLPTAPKQQASYVNNAGLMMDTNFDGYMDTRYWDYDLNGDGTIDTRYFDTDLDGRINQTLVFDYTQPNGKIWCYDTNQDGYMDFWGWDKNNDGRVDTWGWDMNRNNIFDTWGADYNGDGLVDGYSYDDNEDGIVDRW